MSVQSIRHARFVRVTQGLQVSKMINRWWMLAIILLAGCGSRSSQDEPLAASAQQPVAERQPAPDGSKKLFSPLSVEETGVDFITKWEKPAAYDRVFYSQNTGGGVTVGDYDKDGLPDLYFSRPSGGGRLYRNQGKLRFQDVTDTAGLRDDDYWNTGASFVDIDNDGDLDLYLCAYGSPNRLYLNDGQGKFQLRADGFGLNFNGASVMMAFADYDRDGDLDGYLVTAGLPPGPHQQFRVKFVNGRPVVLDELAEFWQLLYLPGSAPSRSRQGSSIGCFEMTASTPAVSGSLRKLVNRLVFKARISVKRPFGGTTTKTAGRTSMFRTIIGDPIGSIAISATGNFKTKH